jgi:hypothetical protein
MFDTSRRIRVAYCTSIGALPTTDEHTALAIARVRTWSFVTPALFNKPGRVASPE